LPARDVAKALTYYVDKLGFRHAFGDPANNYVGVRRGGVELHLQCHQRLVFCTATTGTREVEGAAEEPASFFAAGFPRGTVLTALCFTGFRAGLRSRLRTRGTVLVEHGMPFSIAFATTSWAGRSAGSDRMNSVTGDLGRPTVGDLAATQAGGAVVAWGSGSGSPLADTGAEGPTS